MVYPMVFTNRAAFDAAVGKYTLLTFDKGPDEIRNTGTGIMVTYGNLVRFDYDPLAQNGPNTGGTVEPHVVMGFPMGLLSTGQTLSSVTAFGFDILRFINNSGMTDSCTIMVSGVFGPPPRSGYDVLFALTDCPSFLGFVSCTPFTPLITTGPDAKAIPCQITIDNMAIKSATTSTGVPSPPTGLNVK